MGDETGHTEDARVDSEVGQKLFEQVWRLWLEPEIADRRERGDLPVEFVLHRAQVILGVEAPPEVRLNEEVRGVVTVTAARPIAKGEVVTLDDIAAIEDVVLTDDDEDVGHVTIFAVKGGWMISFDFRRNASRMRAHADRAEGFLTAAEDALRRSDLHVSAETLFAAVELVAKGLLLWMPDKRFLNSKSHKALHSRFNVHRHLGNIDGRFATLLNRLTELREAARYVGQPLNLGRPEADAMIRVGKEMLTELRAETPTRYRVSDENPAANSTNHVSVRTRRAAITATAARPLEAGELVTLDDTLELGNRAASSRA